MFLAEKCEKVNTAIIIPKLITEKFSALEV